MTTFTITTPGPYREGQRVWTLQSRSVWGVRGVIERVQDHEILVRVGGRPLAFQKHEQGVWRWSGWRQGEMDVGDERQGRLV